MPIVPAAVTARCKALAWFDWLAKATVDQRRDLTLIVAAPASSGRRGRAAACAAEYQAARPASE